MLYYNNDSVIPNSRPTRIRLDNGLTITNPDDQTLLDNGWKIAPAVPNINYPDRIEWNGSEWIVVSPTQADIDAKWESVKETCKIKLAKTDYKVIKAIEASAVNGTNINDELNINVVMYRQALRDIYNNVNNIDPFFVQWPVLEESLSIS